MQNEAVFDPGFGKCLIGFLPIYMDYQLKINSNKNLSIKKANFKLFNPQLKAALESTLGFWVGCILWGAILKSSNKNQPAEIQGNSFLNLKEEELSQYDFEIEFSAIKKYIEDYAKNMQYFCGKSAFLPHFYAKIVENYQVFLQTNNHFIAVDFTDKIQFQEQLSSFENPNEDELQSFKAAIYKAIEDKNLAQLLDFAKDW